MIRGIVLSVLTLGLMTWGALCSAVSVSINPYPKTALSGQAVPVTVNLDTATQIRGVQIRIAYNTDLLSFASATRGTLFTGLNVGWWRAFNGEPNEDPGVLRVECIIFGAGIFTTGPGNLLNLTFNALAEGYSELSILEIKLYEPVNGTIIPGVSGTNGAVIIGPNPAYAYAKCWLQGPYQDAVMSTALNSRIPLTSPYPADPIIVTSIPTGVVDWVLVELRQSLNGPAVKSQAMWLFSDGSVKSPGKPFMLFMNTASQAWYVVVKARNHLSLKSSSPLSLSSSGTPPLLDFRLSSNVYPDGSTIQLGAYCAMKAGDANQDGVINFTDRNLWRIQAGTKGYLSADFDLDGKVLPRDLNLCWRTNSRVDNPEPAMRGGINFSLADAELEQIGDQTYLKIRIKAAAANENSPLGTGVVLLNYDQLSFGENVCASAAVSVLPGALISATFPVYQLIVNDYEPGCLAITYEFTGTANAGIQLPSAAAELMQLRLRIADLNHYAGLGFGPDMQNQQFQADNFNLLSPVNSNPGDEFLLPGSPQGLSLQHVGTAKYLSWQAVAGCSYKLYYSTPQNPAWQILAANVQTNSWTDYADEIIRFYKITANSGNSEK